MSEKIGLFPDPEGEGAAWLSEQDLNWMDRVVCRVTDRRRPIRGLPFPPGGARAQRKAANCAAGDHTHRGSSGRCPYAPLHSDAKPPWYWGSGRGATDPELLSLHASLKGKLFLRCARHRVRITSMQPQNTVETANPTDMVSVKRANLEKPGRMHLQGRQTLPIFGQVKASFAWG
jgi:hypothetical protein